jgi:hypothetical protein
MKFDFMNVFGYTDGAFFLFYQVGLLDNVETY